MFEHVEDLFVVLWVDVDFVVGHRELSERVVLFGGDFDVRSDFGFDELHAVGDQVLEHLYELGVGILDGW